MLNLKKIKITPKVYKTLPQEPGVYMFWRNKKLLYVGKAQNLKNRITSYFSQSLLPKTSKLMTNANYISFIVVISELEALLLEAKLIRKYKPKYNSTLRDDKSPLYIRTTNDFYPRILTARRIETGVQTKSWYGPFPSATSVRFVLKSIRRIFPFATHKLGARACIESHIGLCNPCPNDIDKIENKVQRQVLRNNYLRNVRFVNKFLSGSIASVKNDLDRNMLEFSSQQKFEEAKEFRDALSKYEYITQPRADIGEFLKNPNFAEDIRNLELSKLHQLLKRRIKLRGNLTRIECFDIAHLAGTFPTASMVTFIKGQKDPALYRHFRIKREKAYDDIASLKEVGQRRIRHINDWGRPDLIVVDGGRAQVSIFRKLFKDDDISVIGIAKQKESLVIPMPLNNNNFIEIVLKPGPARNLITRIRNEAHRFARRYHHHLVSRQLLA